LLFLNKTKKERKKHYISRDHASTNLDQNIKLRDFKMVNIPIFDAIFACFFFPF
jgi:hypothetical protein